MKNKDTISKGPKRRDETCYEVREQIIIPVGTILRQQPGKPGVFECPVAHGKFILDAVPALENGGAYRRVVA